MSVLTFLLLGALAGFLGGLLGLGGGLVLVPGLFFIFRWQQLAPELLMHMAVGTSLAAAIFTAIVSTWAHHQRGAVQWGAVRGMVPGIVIGAIVGGLVAERLASDSLRVIFGIFELLVAAQLASGLQPKASRTLPRAPALAASGAAIGGLSAILGIGGGTMTVPFLTWCNVDMRRAVATSAACGLPICLAGTIGHIIAGWSTNGLPAAATGYVFWPAVLMLAARTHSHAISLQALRRVFALVLAIIGLRMLVG
jgi:uncharacterized protein